MSSNWDLTPIIPTSPPTNLHPVSKKMYTVTFLFVLAARPVFVTIYAVRAGGYDVVIFFKYNR